MKATYLIPPAAALMIVGSWNVMQMRSISSLENERADLRKRIASTTSGMTGADFLLASHSVNAKSGGAKDKIDWKSLGSQIVEMQQNDSVKDMRAMALFQQRLEKMTKEEMVAAMDEIAAMNLPADARAALEAMIIEPLIKADPELALTRFADRIQSDPDGVGWQLSNALKEWAKNDLSAATAWFDKQIADGTFDSKSLDGRSDTRLQFEGALLESLLGSDPDAAARRLAELPEDQRREVLQQLSFDELTPEQRNAYAQLVRGLVPQDEREGSFAHIASELVDQGGFSEVSTFLDGVKASASERAAAARDAADSYLEQLAQDGNVTAKDVDEMRAWLKTQAPELIDSITGKALAEAAQDHGKFKFAEAAKLALQYHESTGNDDVLVAFLESFSARSNLKEARHLAGMINDPAKREAILTGWK
ncbi:MAG: hypothetical protein ABI162_20140 [Luteolibacter sp.]